MNKRQLYKELNNLIRKYGQSYPKRHGNWIRLKYIGDYYFTMDSWSSAICIEKNPEYQDMRNGNGYFKSEEKIRYFGLDFGGFECSLDEEMLNFYIQNLKCELGLDYDFSQIVLP